MIKKLKLLCAVIINLALIGNAYAITLVDHESGTWGYGIGDYSADFFPAGSNTGWQENELHSVGGAPDDFQTLSIVDFGAKSTNKALKIACESYGAYVFWMGDFDSLPILPNMAGINRMSMYVGLPVGYPSSGGANVHIGTYTRDPVNGDVYSAGTHFYHYLHMVGSEYFSKVVLNQKPQHRSSAPIGDCPANNPTAPTWNYYEGFTRFYIDTINTVSTPWNMYIDEVEFYTQTEQEDNNFINSIVCTYMGSGRYVISWQGNAETSACGRAAHNFEVRRSVSPITNENYSYASVVDTVTGITYAYDNYEADFVINDYTGENGDTEYFAILDMTTGVYVTSITYVISPIIESTLPAITSPDDFSTTSALVEIEGTYTIDPDLPDQSVIITWTLGESSGFCVAALGVFSCTVPIELGANSIVFTVTDSNTGTDSDTTVVMRTAVPQASITSTSISHGVLRH